MKALTDHLSRIIPPERLLTRLIDRHAYARDASFYRLVPQVVVRPRSEQEIVALLELARAERVPLVFRGAGTSLSGQAITDGILVEIGRYWRGIEVEAGGDRILLQPGVIGAHANHRLRAHGRKIGPDPASLNACFIGGIVANNASGMCCGVHHNAYHTMASIRFVLPSGNTFDTADPDADNRLRDHEPAIHQGLLDLRARVLADEALCARIRDKYCRKNTMGYSLNAFIDYSAPVDILAHLLVGSEGTLGFISRVTLATVPDAPCKSAALLLFATLEEAAAAVVVLKDAGAAALEIMDRASLRAVEREAGMPKELAELPMEAAALLVEFQEESAVELEARVAGATKALSAHAPMLPFSFTTNEEKRQRYWNVRKGLFPAVGAARPGGTTVIIEDLCFRVEQLAPAIRDLQALFRKHHYQNAIIFGHARDGNLHFVISQAFGSPEGVQQYDAFMREVIELTSATYGGALKAEHGTGRNMAPFLETEWGVDAVALMRELKAMIDPANILNPGVLLNADPQCHLANLKPMPLVSAVVDTCTECGFCESWCPSRDLTMTPRRRIGIARELEMLRSSGEEQRLLSESMQEDLAYSVAATCATDGLCALGCPVKIDTGAMVKELRHLANGPFTKLLAGWTAKRFGWTVSGARLGLRVGHGAREVLGAERLQALSGWLNRLSGHRLPIWHEWMPAPARPLPTPRVLRGERCDEIVYFPACLTRGMGALPGEGRELSPTEAFLELLDEAHIRARYPRDLAELCCGQPYSSKGFHEAAVQMAERMVMALWEASEQGELAIVMDTSPCVYRVKTYDQLLKGPLLKKWRQLRILDVIEFLHDTLLEQVMPTDQPVSVILHPTCSTVKMKLVGKMEAIAHLCAARVHLPEDHGCCGFAGDRGLLVPELTQSATAAEARTVGGLPRAARCYSTCRTCEMGMAKATGRPYSSIIHLVHDAVCARR